MVLRVCKENRQSVLEQVRSGKIDAAVLSTTHLVDEIILAMHIHNILPSISNAIPDHRAHNTTVPYEIVWASAIAAKMKIKTSLTDIPYAITDHRTLVKLGYTLCDLEDGLSHGLMQESSLRFLLGKYNFSALLQGYNIAVQDHIMPLCDLEANIHILDCTDLEVNYFNANYENSGIGYSKRSPSGLEEKARGYKLSTLRGIVKDSGIIEEIRFGPLNVHDLTLSEEMLLSTSVLKPGDILINDRGFLSRDLINQLKSDREIDTYIPLKKNMQAYDIAVQVAKEQNEWKRHPITRYSTQKICLVKDLGPYWKSDNSQNDVDINGCVVWDNSNDSYFVFATTDITQTAANILRMYNLRPEIEEDYRQLKEFWKIEDFKSTKLNVIVFHVVAVLFGYLFFQLFTMLPEGEQYAGKSLPVILKNYIVKVQGFIVLYAGTECGVITLLELMELYDNCETKVKEKLKFVFRKM